MGSQLPAITFEAFGERLHNLAPVSLQLAAPALLFAHYQTLRRWNPRLALIGPGTTGEVLTRHYGESLAACSWLEGDETVVDVGSGAGFPGLVLALALPGLKTTLVESRSRKHAFLAAALRAARSAMSARSGTPAPDSPADGSAVRGFRGAPPALSCTALNARIGRPLPAGLPLRIDVVMSRGVRLTPDILEPLVDRCRTGRFLLWQGVEAEIPATLRITRRIGLAGSDRRQLVEAVPAAD